MAQFTFPADIERFINVEELRDQLLPVGIILLFEEEVDPEAIGLPGTWEEL
jgi:hypothetical protein